ncbi:LuxR C-terminal-related transcriptional regulator, partial [Thermodesulfobacteriota bacterium]
RDELRPLRVLAVDDDKSILEFYKEALSVPIDGKLSKYEFEVIKCEQGDQALEETKKALERDRPFAVTFLDLNLPPGPDGIWAGEQIRKLDPFVNFVIVTGMIGIDLREIILRIPPEDKILYVQKPFYIQELRQFATALGAKWRSERLLQKTNAELKEKVGELGKSQSELLVNRVELENVNNQLMETNNALSVLARNLDRTKKESEKQLLQKTRTLILPIIERLHQSRHLERYRADLDLLISHIENLTSDITNDIKISASLSSTELRIAAMIRNDMSSHEIANQLHISLDTVKTHRKNIRKKLNLKNSRINLRSYLASEM